MSTVKRECQVVMIPTQKVSPISLEKDGAMRLKFIGTMDNGYINTSTQQNQHIYILSDDEIKVGDWFYSTENTVEQYKGSVMPISDDKKIIATTNQTLEMKKDVVGGFETGIAFPQPSPAFIQKYIESYNNGKPIETVLVDYIEYRNKNFPATKIHDNTITISKVKDSWTREEVKDLIEKFINDSKPNSEFFKKYGDMPGGIPALREKWIEENL